MFSSYRVVELLLFERGDVHLVVDCYLKDQPRRMQVFPFLFAELTKTADVKDSKHHLILEAVENNLKVFHIYCYLTHPSEMCSFIVLNCS